MSDDIAMQIAAAVASRTDPLERFLASLPEWMRLHAEETIRLRNELVEYTQRLVVENDAQRAAGYAAWITQHAHVVAYRWPMLLRSAQRFAELDVQSLHIVIPGGT